MDAMRACAVELFWEGIGLGTIITGRDEADGMGAIILELCGHSWN